MDLALLTVIGIVAVALLFDDTYRLDPAELEQVRAALAEAGLSISSLVPRRIRTSKRQNLPSGQHKHTVRPSAQLTPTRPHVPQPSPSLFHQPSALTTSHALP
jgi:hypothetical protein